MHTPSSFEIVLQAIYKLRLDDFKKRFQEHISQRRAKLVFVLPCLPSAREAVRPRMSNVEVPEPTGAPRKKKETEEERFSRLISIFREMRGECIK